MVESARIDCLNMLNVATTFFMYADFIVHPPGFGILIIADYAPILFAHLPMIPDTGTTESGEKRRNIHQFEATYLLELYGQTGGYAVSVAPGLLESGYNYITVRLLH